VTEVKLPGVVCCRARDKKKNIADEKAQAQRRLLRATNRRGRDKSEHQRQKEMIERRREELVYMSPLTPGLKVRGLRGGSTPSLA